MPFRPVAAVLVAVALMLGMLAPALAAEPEQVIAAFNDSLLEAMKGGAKLGFKGRAERLRPAVLAAYDMEAMTRATLGVAAGKLSPEESARLVDAYARFSIATYAGQFDEWNGERFEVDAARSSTQGAVIVPSRILPAEGEPIAIDYLMRENQGRWRVVDVFYQGSVSQVAVRRSEFLSIFRAKGLDGLIAVLDSQSAAQAGQ